MKRSILIPASVLPLLLAAAASAQIVPVRAFAASLNPVAPMNPVAGLPMSLPSPMTGPLTGLGIEFPTPTLPLIAPAPKLLPGPATSVPFVLPSRGVVVPMAAITEEHEIVINPVRRATPGVTLRLAEKSAVKPAPNAKKGDQTVKNGLDHLFDGSADATDSNREPVSSDRHISFPERDLERELGL